MKTMLKRLLSLTLCILMLAAMLPTNFSLAEGEGSFSISGGGSLRVGGTLHLSATGVGASDTIVWSSDDTGIATVDQSGVVSGVALGETQIQAVRTYRDANDEVQVETRKTTVSVVTYYTVTFVIPDTYSYGEGVAAPTPPAQQVIKDHTATMPETPAIPEGYRYFVAWNLGDHAYNFGTPVTGNITLTAEFSDKCLVSFEDADGGIMHTAPVTMGETLANPNLDVVPHADRSFTGEWKIKNTDTTFVFGTTPVTENIRLVPQFIHTYYVFFNSNGSPVPPMLVGANQRITNPPAAPTRAGYTFVHWYLDNENTAFNFATTPITSTTVLTAKWTPRTVSYQIVYWVEKANISGDPGENPNNYQYVATTSMNALAGSEVSAASTSVAGNAAIYANSGDSLSITSNSSSNKIAIFRHGSTAVVSGTGTTVINAYFKRIPFTLTFNLGPNGTMVKDGITYSTASGVVYSLTAKYGQNIEAAWPSSANATITKGTGSSDKFTSWSITNIRATGGGLASKRFALDYTLLPNSTTATAASLLAAYGNVSASQLNYWLEVVPGQPGTKKTFSRVEYTFALSEEHSQLIDGGSMLPKIIAGFSHVGTETGTESGVYTYNFYYTRAKYTLSFDTQMNNLSINDVNDVPHGAPLLAYKPADPVVAGETFLGWYYEAECRTAVDWNNDAMPTGNLMVFANWESDEFTANFYFDDTLDKLVHHAGVEGGRAIADPNLYNYGQAYDVNGNPYDPDGGVELKGVFKGWYWFLPGSYNRERAGYSFETLIWQDITLFARWDAAGFKVTYNWGAITPKKETLPVDNNTYAYGAGATVLATYSTQLSEGPNRFVGWMINGVGPAYFPGSIIRITGDTVLVGKWAAISSEISLSFDKNAPGEAGTIIWDKVAPNSQYFLPGSDAFTRSDGYALIGWNTNAAGTGTSYDLGGSLRRDRQRKPCTPCGRLRSSR